ncbi:glycosyltransferase [Flavobacterium sp. CFS9]|uniref:Glycosyltransferase n=1 Tax=Flavobacterium sp. CFS9 TaxID=3143118 RepID=A0AAT9GXT8_9FLAO
MNVFRVIRRKLGNNLPVIKYLYHQGFFFPYKGLIKNDVLIFDDIFPHPASGFRLEEFRHVFENFEKSKVIVEPTAYRIVGTPVENHQNHINEFEEQYKSLKNKIKLRKGFVNINSKLFYCVFINNIFRNLSWLEKHKIPFVFTLYPGGGFQLNEIPSDDKLKKVFLSPMFRKVIVTQKITHAYLLDKKLCDPEKIEFIFGGVVPQVSLKKDLKEKKNYLDNKTTFDICFCAAKYMSKGEDKGYDVFIEFAMEIANKYDFIKFHVVGGFTEEDIDIAPIKDKISFYGYQNFESLGAIYKNMDILISPNKAFILGKGAFDGFPLGTVVEAALNGVVVLITDELKQNNAFVPDIDLILIESKKESIIKQVIKLIENPERLYAISNNGRSKFENVYSNEIQMSPRIALLQNEIARNIK